MSERGEAQRLGDTALMADIEARALSLNACHRGWTCDERRMALTADALYMHCLPASVGEEVAPSVMARFAPSVARQASKKLYVIMAVLAGALVPDLEAVLDEMR
jgi:ornithine carbamoyltransferase